MGEEEIAAMKAGSELDRLVGERVMGCRVVKRRRGTFDLVVPGSFNRIDYVTAEGAWAAMPRYSTDVAAAFEVALRLNASKSGPDGLNVEFELSCETPTFIRASFREMVNDEQFGGCNVHRERYAVTSSVPLAICLAALMFMLDD